ncbi:hypothetical protein G6F66_014595 [Rhizopus arrhizus]|nr:hypothetical protein G6F66_014595 [Rhizopus arrhizus]
MASISTLPSAASRISAEHRNGHRGQAIGDREHHAVAQLDIQHGAVELPGVEQAQCIEHAVGMRDLVALLLQRLLHQCGQVELVLHQQQVADVRAGFGMHAGGACFTWGTAVCDLPHQQRGCAVSAWCEVLGERPRRGVAGGHRTDCGTRRSFRVS